MNNWLILSQNNVTMVMVPLPAFNSDMVGLGCKDLVRNTNLINELTNQINN